ncbi:LysM domain-containing protein [Microbacterium sp. BWT-B31]|uniref:LysM peptidoglycan-binding domain-containing protein n=1 Tax=Microbacterium sp. BWT-B31 TaxID=3232072 RepID=UPI003527EADC
MRARALTVGAPITVAGSIALLLAGAPANAAEPNQEHSERMPRPDARASARPAAALPVAAAAASRGLPAKAVPDRAVAPRATMRTSLAAPETYTIQPGDTVSAISEQFGLRTADVLALNGLAWSSIIYPGEVLRLTGEPEPAAEPAPAPPAETAAPPIGESYTVQSGDTIWAIAEGRGVSTDAVLAANGLDRASIIYPGQVIAVPPAVAAASFSAPVPVSVPGLDDEQVAHAQLIIRVARELGVPDRGIVVALASAMQESGLRNLDWGDRDSLGLFQQRPSTGWGTEAEVQDPERATRLFFGGPDDPNGYQTLGLLDIPNWQQMTVTEAAQAVQISAYPDAYAQWEQPATAWLAALG